ncbi:MAG: GGDEF domain-containing protein [Roseovarius sp.]
MSSSDECDPTLAGITTVVSALKQPAMVIDQTGQVHCANARAMALIGEAAGAPLQDVLLTPESHLYNRLARLVRSSAPAYLRLEFSNGKPTIFQGSMLRGPDGRGSGLILLVADNASALIGKFLNLKSDSRKFRQQIDHSQRRQRALRQEAAQLKRLSETDPLTGLLNVRAFEEKVRHALADRPGRHGALIFLDLNDFKRVNDEHGHEAGDKLIQHVAQALSFPPHSWVATGRMGGDEFALWMPGTEAEAVPEVLASLQARVSVPYTLIGRAGRLTEICMTAAAGAACCPDDATGYAALKRIADRRMYANKPETRLSPTRQTVK